MNNKQAYSFRIMSVPTMGNNVPLEGSERLIHAADFNLPIEDTHNSYLPPFSTLQPLVKDAFWNVQDTNTNHDPPSFEDVYSYHNVVGPNVNVANAPNLVAYSSYELPAIPTNTPYYQYEFPDLSAHLTGYNLTNPIPNVHNQQFQPHVVMTPKHIQHATDICEQNKVPVRKCKNSSRGCQIHTFSILVNLHEEYCSFPLIRSFRVYGKMNLLLAKQNCLLPFCESYYKRYNIMFLYKFNNDKTIVSIVSQSRNRSFKYTLTFKDFKNKTIFSISNGIGPDIQVIPAWILIKYGPMVKYTIQIFH